MCVFAKPSASTVLYIKIFKSKYNIDEANGRAHNRKTLKQPPRGRRAGEVPWRLGLCYAKENVKILIMSRGSSTLTSRRSRAQRMRKNCGKFIDFDFRDRKQKRERIKWNKRGDNTCRKWLVDCLSVYIQAHRHMYMYVHMYVYIYICSHALERNWFRSYQAYRWNFYNFIGIRIKNTSSRCEVITPTSPFQKDTAVSGRMRGRGWVGVESL